MQICWNKRKCLHKSANPTEKPTLDTVYIKIQLETIDITMRLYGVNLTNPYMYIIPQSLLVTVCLLFQVEF